MIKNLLTICAIFCAFAASAQKTNNGLVIKLQGKKTKINAGEQVVLSAQGVDETSSYQWQVSTDGTNWQDIPKANGYNYETANLDKTQFYRVITRPNEGYLSVETVSKPYAINFEENVASLRKRN
jgi:hypothetical protein